MSKAARRGPLGPRFHGSDGGWHRRAWQGVPLDVLCAGAAAFPKTGPVEAMAWDGGQGLYNYYKLDRSPGDDGSPGVSGAPRRTPTCAPPRLGPTRASPATSMARR